MNIHMPPANEKKAAPSGGGAQLLAENALHAAAPPSKLLEGQGQPSRQGW